MEVIVAIVSCFGVGISILALKFRSPVWPPLHHECNDLPAETLKDGREATDHKNDLDSLDTKLSTDEVDSAAEETVVNNSTTTLYNCNMTNEIDSVSKMGFTNGESSNVDDYANNTTELDIINNHSSTSTASHDSIRQRRVLFVIAHPDDECMFFGPSILQFTRKEKAMVYLLCLTNGSYENKAMGKIRQRELWNSCELLGIPATQIILYSCSHLPDHPAKKWPIVNTANIINKHLHILDCDMVITFDDRGVSGHINHRSCHAAILHLIEEHLLPTGCHAYCLDSVNITRKYSFLLDLPLSVLSSSCVVTAGKDGHAQIRAAMKAHASQYVWFRRLYMIFSRYVVINTLTLMTLDS